MWEWLNTVELLKSELTKDKINPVKLRVTKINCKNVRDKILLFRLLKFFKSLIEKKRIKKEHPSPRYNEYNPIKLAKIYFPSIAAFTSGGI